MLPSPNQHNQRQHPHPRPHRRPDVSHAVGEEQGRDEEQDRARHSKQLVPAHSSRHQHPHQRPPDVHRQHAALETVAPVKKLPHVPQQEEHVRHDQQSLRQRHHSQRQPHLPVQPRPVALHAPHVLDRQQQQQHLMRNDASEEVHQVVLGLRQLQRRRQVHLVPSPSPPPPVVLLPPAAQRQQRETLALLLLLLHLERQHVPLPLDRPQPHRPEPQLALPALEALPERFCAQDRVRSRVLAHPRRRVGRVPVHAVVGAVRPHHSSSCSPSMNPHLKR
mmetsp:Transcript_11571/g.39942  ORF Transcript_11571/g.39942 Transcript_11571/m.39942 type:complete len:277 (-) Transcript_11571:919-1749(-)